MQFTNLQRLIFTAITLICTLQVSAQDLLAKQAPVDKRMRKVDTLSLQRLIKNEQIIMPSAEIYDHWDNEYVHEKTAIPDSFLINLKNFCMPTLSRVITSNFGARWGRQHKGLDIKVYIGDTIRSAFPGKVRIVRYEPRGYGRYIVIRHPNGLETIYAHLSKQIVNENQTVKAGDPIGLGGNTGRSTGSHLHFETRFCGIALNPAIFFDFRAQDVTADSYMFKKDSYMYDSALATRLRGKVGNGSYSPEQVYGVMPRTQKMVAEVKTVRKKYHKVKKGETLISISRKLGLSVSELCKRNSLSKKAKIKPGQILIYS